MHEKLLNNFNNFIEVHLFKKSKFFEFSKGLDHARQKFYFSLSSTCIKN